MEWSYKRCGLSGGGTVFYYLCAYEMWPDKEDGLWWSGLIRGVVSLEGDNLVFSFSVHVQSGLIKGVSLGGSGLIRGGLLYLFL